MSCLHIHGTCHSAVDRQSKVVLGHVSDVSVPNIMGWHVSQPEVLGNGCFRGDRGPHSQLFYQAVFAQTPAKELKPGLMRGPSWAQELGQEPLNILSLPFFLQCFHNPLRILCSLWCDRPLHTFLWYTILGYPSDSPIGTMLKGVPKVIYWAVGRQYVNACFYYSLRY